MTDVEVIELIHLSEVQSIFEAMPRPERMTPELLMRGYLEFKIQEPWVMQAILESQLQGIVHHDLLSYSIMTDANDPLISKIYEMAQQLLQAAS